MSEATLYDTGVFVIADDLVTKHGPRDVRAPESTNGEPADEYSIATALVPARGTE